MMTIADHNIWFEPRPARLNLVKNLIEITNNKYNGYSVLFKSKVDGLSASELMESYIQDNPHIKETNSRKPRYGEYYQMSVDLNIGMVNLVKTVREFVNEIIYGYDDLPYVVLYKQKHGRYYLHIWIADREWGNELQVYSRDYWYDKDTGRPSNEDDPNAILKCRKGDPKLDKSGNPIYRNWNSRKSLIFNEGYEYTQPRLYDTIHAILIKIKSTFKNVFKDGWKRVYFKKGGNRYKEHLYREVAHFQNYIQWMCLAEIVNTWNYESWQHDLNKGVSMKTIDLRNPYGKTAKAIHKLFYKYKTRLSKGEFHTADNRKFSIFKGVRYETGTNNLVYLKMMFKSDLMAILKASDLKNA